MRITYRNLTRKPTRGHHQTRQSSLIPICFLSVSSSTLRHSLTIVFSFRATDYGNRHRASIRIGAPAFEPADGSNRQQWARLLLPTVLHEPTLGLVSG